MIKRELLENGKEIIVFMGCIFVLGKSKKFDRDFFQAKAILEKKTITRADRLVLISIYQSAYHTSGKIEGVTSCDSSATNCAFCKAMREKAKGNPAHICNYCYDKNQEKYKINSLNRHSLNMLIMQTIEFESDELAIIPTGILNRIDSAGDIPNKTYARNMIKIAMLNSVGRFAFWAKNTLALIAATDELRKPENAIYIRSSEIIGRRLNCLNILTMFSQYTRIKRVVKTQLKTGLQNAMVKSAWNVVINATKEPTKQFTLLSCCAA